jgi:CBS-domain-containing membrane protein
MKGTTTKSASRPFRALIAADLMSTPVMTIPHDMTLQEAARLLCAAHITGAPVVDAEGRCLGVLSSSDFVSRAKEGEQAAGEDQKVTCFIAPWGEMIQIEESSDEVRKYMTARPVTVVAATPIAELAQKMVDAHIHRVIVVADDDKPRGIVTSIDVLAAVARTGRQIRSGRPRVAQ